MSVRSGNLRTNVGQRCDFVIGRHLLSNSSIPDPYMLKLCELCRGNGHKVVFVQSDSFRSTNELPPLSRGAEYDRKHKHEEENGNQRVETPDACLSYQFSCLSGVGHGRCLTQKRPRATQETKSRIGRKNF